MVTARKHKRKLYNRLLKLDRPEYFGYRTLQLAKELGLVTTSTDGEETVIREDERQLEEVSDGSEASRENWKARNLFEGLRPAKRSQWDSPSGEGSEGESEGDAESPAA